MPDVTRRSMLVMGAATVGATVLGGSGAALAEAAPRSGGAVPRRSAFVPAVGSLFTARSAAGRFTLRLVEIGDVAPVPGDENSYNLLFDPKGQVPVPEGIYRLTSVRAPGCDFFISPVEGAGSRPRLQALVNRHMG